MLDILLQIIWHLLAGLGLLLVLALWVGVLMAIYLAVTDNKIVKKDKK